MAVHSVVIADTETTSPAINVAGQEVVALSIGTVAATAATFTAAFVPGDSPKGGATATQTFRTLRDDGATEVSVTTTDDSFIEFDPPLRGLYQLKIIANVAASGDETWSVITRGAAG